MVTRVPCPSCSAYLDCVLCGAQFVVTDEMIERGAQRLYDISDERVRVDGVEWINEPDGYKMLWRDQARAVLRAAFGGTR